MPVTKEDKQIIVDVITPVFINGGGTGIYNVDIVSFDNSVYVVNTECLASFIVRRGLEYDPEQTRRLFLLAMREYHDKKLSCKPYRLRATVKVKDEVPSDGREVQLPLAEYIPGSTIKGVLRTGLLYSYLDNIRDRVLDTVKEILDLLRKGSIRPVDAAKKIEELVFKGAKHHGRGVFVFDALRLVYVSDPLQYDTRLEQSTIERINIFNNKIITKSYGIVFSPGSRYFYNLTIQESPAKLMAASNLTWVKRLREVDKKVNLEALGEGLKYFSKVSLEYEIHKLHSSKIGDKILANLKFLQKVNSDNCYLIKLGYGAGHHWKTILPWIFIHDKKLWREIINLMSILYNHRWDSESITLIAGQPAGWVKMCFGGDTF